MSNRTAVFTVRARDTDLPKVQTKTEGWLRRQAKRFPGIREARALWRYFRDPAQPWSQRAVAAGALLYLITPLDAFPDWLPGGLLDDAAVATTAVLYLGHAIQPYLDRG